jgi:hypothetical protein
VRERFSNVADAESITAVDQTLPESGVRLNTYVIRRRNVNGMLNRKDTLSGRCESADCFAQAVTF